MTELSQQGLEELKASNDDDDVQKLLEARLMAGISEMAEWSYEAERAWQYYASRQWQDLSERERHRIIPIVANLIRRDLDQMVSRVIESEFIISPIGRDGRFYELGKLLVNLLQWTRDEEMNWFNDLEDVIQDCFHGGEGILRETWNQSASHGKGMPESKHQDPRFFVWDWHAKDWQKEDAEWCISYEPKKVDYLKAKYDLDEVDADYPTLHVTEHERAWLNEYRNRIHLNGEQDSLDFSQLERRAYEKIQYSKRPIFSDAYLNTETKQLETKTNPDGGEDINITTEDYNKLSKKKQANLVKQRVESHELWRTVVVNKKVVENELSIYDKSKGGHGQFPFCWFSYVRMRDRSHAKGEIDYLIGMQDLINRSLSRWLEQLMIAGSSYIHSVRGSMAPEDLEKVDQIGRVPMQHISTYAGFQEPQIVGGDPKGAQLFASGYDLLSQVKDSISGVYDVNRGGMPYQTSGRGIRALQSSTDLLGVLPQKHIESGLRQSTALRLHNIKQLMRGTRLAEIADSGTDDLVPLYIGDTLKEIQDAYGLQVWVDPQSGRPALGPDGQPMILADKDGEEVKAIAIGDAATEGIDFSRIRFELDTGKERDREQRMEVAREFLAQIGPGAARWAVEEAGLHNSEALLEDMEKFSSAEGFLSQVDELSKATGMDPTQIIQIAMDDVKKSAQQKQQQDQFGAGVAVEGQPLPPPGSGQGDGATMDMGTGPTPPMSQESINQAADVAADQQQTGGA